MRLAEIQVDDVVVAGQYLESHGEPVNGWTLRRALGDKGRPDHLMDVWQSHQDPVTTAPQDTKPATLPAELAEQVDRGRSELAAHYDGLMLAMFKLADERLKAHYQADLDRLTAERGELQEQLAAASASVSATEAALSDTRLGAERTREALAAARTGIAVSERRVHAVEERCAAAERTTLAAQAAVATAENEAQQLREKVTELTSALAVFREHVAAVRTQIAAVKFASAAQQQRAELVELALAEVCDEQAITHSRRQMALSDGAVGSGPSW